jgi:hypothetical protein
MTGRRLAGTRRGIGGSSSKAWPGGRQDAPGEHLALAKCCVLACCASVDLDHSRLRRGLQRQLSSRDRRHTGDTPTQVRCAPLSSPDAAAKMSIKTYNFAFETDAETLLCDTSHVTSKVTLHVRGARPFQRYCPEPSTVRSPARGH